MNSINDIQLPTLRFGDIVLGNTFEFLDKLLADIILYFAYASALLCGFKFVIYILNGFATKSRMGAASLDDPSFRH
jgi:hypothetical protein